MKAFNTPAREKAAQAQGSDQNASLFARTRALVTPVARPGEPVDALNIPWRFHYCILAVSAFNLSGPPLLMSFTEVGQELSHPVVRMMCFYGLALPPVFLYLAKRWHYEFKHWFFACAIYSGTFSLFLSSMFLDELRGPMFVAMLLSPAGAAYYLRPHTAAVHIVVTAALVVGIGVSVGTAEVIIQAIIVATVLCCGAFMLGALRRLLIGVVERNRDLSEQDALTGAANVRHFERRLGEELERFARGGRPFALIGIDLDDFKQVNDRFSHTLGDEVLVASADAMRMAITEADLLVRRGGDEFIVIAPAIDGRDLDQICLRIGAEVARARHALCPEIIPTATTAWVECEHGDTAAVLLQRVDDALHEVKIDAPSTRRGTVSEDDVADVVDNVIQLHGLGAPSPQGALEAGRQARDIRSGSENPMVGATSLAWRAAAASTLMFSSTAMGTGAAGISPESFGTGTIALLAFASLVLAPAFYAMSMRESESRIAVHALAIGAIVVITIACAVVGPLGDTVVEMYLMPMLIIPALVAPRQAVWYGIAAAIGYGAFIIGHGYHPAGLRISTSLSNVTVLAMIIGLTRANTVEAAARNASLARIDALTGLPNLRRLRARLADEVRRCELSGDDFGLIMFDLDDFKSVNDRHSHSHGDLVLEKVARALEDTARHADMPARRGGDEFALVLTDCDESALSQAASRVADAVVQTRIATTPDVVPTASVGRVLWHTGESVDDVLARVDAELHDRKAISHQQRDRSANAVSS